VNVDRREQRIRVLLDSSRTCQQRGDLCAALRYAREALALHPHCSTIHALLGHLHEQTGNKTAAQYHFQAALSVPRVLTDTRTASTRSSQELRQPQGRWMPVVLVGCILFSSLALLCSFWPNRPRVEHGSIQFMPTERRMSTQSPLWTLHAPSPAQLTEPNQRQSASPHPAQATSTVLLASNDTPAPITATPENAEPTAPTGVLGPPAHTRAPLAATRATMEQAHQAYAHGQYKVAATSYEELLRDQEKIDPLLYHNIAWCYYRLGNTERSTEFLEKAMQAYQTQAVLDPQSADIQQHLGSCTALRALLTSR